ncbi:MerR family transcriptional regulator [Streptomyces termitum]|uniref:DNA polymerase III subunit beta family protein n=1 Tax=Streptomyces termitum TaxID=67368 RepID=UPI0033A321D8
MPPSELMPIGVFARRSGLTPSALRFYADSGLLPPAEVDPVTGYRYYAAGQVARATALRRLREIDVPLTTALTILDAGPEEASRLVDEHVAGILGDAAAALRKAAVIKSALGGGASGPPVAVLKGPVLADAVEQVLTATAHEPGLPVLAGLRIEADGASVALTATDRYRLAHRTLVPVRPAERAWAGTVDGDDLRAAVSEVRRSPLVRLEAVPHGLRLRMPGRADRHCRLLSEPFPDHRLLLASLEPATTRATLAKHALLRALEEQPGAYVALRVTGGAVTVRALPDGPEGAGLPAVTEGPEVTVRFGLTTLHPAVSTVIGPDVMLDLRGGTGPATVRSADRGDLTTLAMPVAPGLPPAPDDHSGHSGRFSHDPDHEPEEHL